MLASRMSLFNQLCLFANQKFTVWGEKRQQDIIIILGLKFRLAHFYKDVVLFKFNSVMLDISKQEKFHVIHISNKLGPNREDIVSFALRK